VVAARPVHRAVGVQFEAEGVGEGTGEAGVGKAMTEGVAVSEMGVGVPTLLTVGALPQPARSTTTAAAIIPTPKNLTLN